MCINGTKGTAYAKSIFTPLVTANNSDITNQAKISYSPSSFALNKTSTYQVTINATYKNKNANTLATVYVCSGDYKCNTSGNGCTK